MELDDLKKSMSTLEDILAEKNNDALSFNVSACDTAQKRIMRGYCKGFILSASLAVVFAVAWSTGFGNNIFSYAMKTFLEVFLVISTFWYIYLYFKTKKINVATSTPVQTLKQVSSLRFYALSGEIVLFLAMTVYMTLFLSKLWILGSNRFWIVSAALVAVIILLVIYLIPRTLRDFKNLTALK